MVENQHKNNYEIEITDDDNDQVQPEENQQNEPLTEDEEIVETRGEREISDNNYFEQLQRLKAEFANYKRRIDKERLELSDIFKSELVKSLLPAIDDFERFFDHSHHGGEDLIAGMKLIYQKLVDGLKMQGLQPVKSVNEKFDPEIHEAVSIEEAEDDEDGLIAEEWLRGYKFNDKLIRPAQVKVKKSVKGVEK